MIKLRVSVIQSVDVGLWLNGALGGEVYSPGEKLEVHCIINGEHVWLEHNTRENKFRVGFGVTPSYDVAMSDADAMALFAKHFMGGIHV